MSRRACKTLQTVGQEAVEIQKELLDQLVKEPMTAGNLEGRFQGLKKAIFERAMGAEMSKQLGYKPGDDKRAGRGSHRKGGGRRTVLTDNGPARIEVPLHREGSFEPLLIP
jgi:putative transposase